MTGEERSAEMEEQQNQDSDHAPLRRARGDPPPRAGPSAHGGATHLLRADLLPLSFAGILIDFTELFLAPPSYTRPPRLPPVNWNGRLLPCSCKSSRLEPDNGRRGPSRIGTWQLLLR